MAKTSPRARPSAPAASKPLTDGHAGRGSNGAAGDPDGGTGGVHELLKSAVEEAARLLHADGAMVYLFEPDSDVLRYAHDAGIESERSREWIRSIRLPVGTGMFGRAVAERGVVQTDDYAEDASFQHAPDPDGVVADIGIRSMVVAPLVAGEQVFGALGTFSRRPGAFGEADVALVRALADHAGFAMANARLIDELGRSRQEVADRADAERALREIAARISASSDLPAVLQRGVDEAARLLRADAARIDLIEETTGLLRWAYASSAQRPSDEDWPDDPEETLDQGISGQAVVRGEVVWTGDYLRDERFPHGSGADQYVSRTGINSVMAAPLIGDAGAFGALTIMSDRANAWAEPDADLLEAIANQTAITITTARLIDE
ncbi:MAG: GAF domain-containing protein, partial [Chloroflexota bacterium]